MAFRSHGSCQDVPGGGFRASEFLVEEPVAWIVAKTLQLSDGVVQGDGARLAFGLFDCPCSVQVSNVTFAGSGPVALSLSAVNPIKDSLQISLRDIRVAGYKQAAQLRAGNDVDIDGLEVACELHGLNITEGTVSLRRISVKGCAGVAVHLKNADLVRLDDVHLAGSGIGLVDQAGAGPSTHAHNVTVEDNYIGILWSAGTVDGRGWHVENNGHRGPPEGEFADQASGGVRTGLMNGAITASHFSDNAGYGLSKGGGGLTAPENWWGSAQGPQPSPSQDSPRLPGYGDRVSLLLDYEPYLTAPP